ncbi:MAG: hypothetical protein ACI8TX_001439 [Hyphomicrobiaceae bacterium]|jgi:hypothetical protein
MVAIAGPEATPVLTAATLSLRPVRLGASFAQKSRTVYLDGMAPSSEPLIIDVNARLEQLFRDFESHGAPGAVESNTFLLHLTGTNPGDHLLTIGPEGSQWQHDYTGNADVEVTMETIDLIAVIDGRIDARLAVASERIEVAGDLQLARQLVATLMPDLPDS